MLSTRVKIMSSTANK